MRRRYRVKRMAGTRSPASDPPADGPLANGPLGDGSLPGGSQMSGSLLAGSLLSGSLLDGPLVDGPVNGPPVHGTPASDSLATMVERLALALERSNVLDYTVLLQRPWRMLWINFAGGMARGLGIGIGFTVLSAMLLYVLRGLMVANLPVIGDLIATIVRLVEQQLRP